MAGSGRKCWATRAQGTLRQVRRAERLAAPSDPPCRPQSQAHPRPSGPSSRHCGHLPLTREREASRFFVSGIFGFCFHFYRFSGTVSSEHF